MIKAINEHLDKNDKLLKHSLIILLASLGTGFVNYAYQLYMGRALGPEQYGILGALFSIIYMEMFSLGSISTVTSKLVSEYNAKNKLGEIKALFSFISTRLLAVGFVVMIITVLLRDFISDYLNFPDSSVVYILAVILLVTFIGTIVAGVLNGMQFFVWSGASSFIGGLFKLVVGVLLVYLGLGVRGALIGLLIGLLIPIILFLVPAKEVLKTQKKKINHIDVFKYALPAICIVMATTLIINIDVVLVRHKLNAFDSGIYTAASTLAKIIWFVTTPLITVMLPKVSPGNGRSILRHTLFYVALLGAGMSAFYFIAPTFIVKTLFGASYLDAVNVIGLFGISIALFSAANVLIVYNLAVRRLMTVYIAIILLLVEVVAINYFATTMIEIVKVVLIVNIILFLAMLAYTKDYLVNEHEA
ncbi:MAG: oligosaccharide flippase family protein [Nanoarchaeota archaeon]